MEYRIEKDSMGEIKVPADKLWGAQTQRSFENFRIGTEKIPSEMVTVFAYLKKAAALTNKELGVVTPERADAIVQACDDILAGKLDGNFPLSVWMTGSGTQFNMNINEVVAHRAVQILKEQGIDETVHPNDHVNHSQSSNDTFPTGLHMAGVLLIEGHLFPAMDRLYGALHDKEVEFKDIVKIGRTHLQDATPLTLGQEFSGWTRMIQRDKEMLTKGVDFLRDLAMGGTAVGTGINCPEGYDVRFAEIVSQLTGTAFHTAPNKFQSLSLQSFFAFRFKDRSKDNLRGSVFYSSFHIFHTVTGNTDFLKIFSEISLFLFFHFLNYGNGQMNPSAAQTFCYSNSGVQETIYVFFSAHVQNFFCNYFIRIIRQIFFS